MPATVQIFFIDKFLVLKYKPLSGQKGLADTGHSIML